MVRVMRHVVACTIIALFGQVPSVMEKKKPSKHPHLLKTSTPTEPNTNKVAITNDAMLTRGDSYRHVRSGRQGRQAGESNTIPSVAPHGTGLVGQAVTVRTRTNVVQVTNVGLPSWLTRPPLPRRCGLHR